MPLISFVGPPCSGKTTVGARLFADLKDGGYTSEFIPEQARVYIATKRSQQKSPNVTLTDDDQEHIFDTQSRLERIFYPVSACSVVITDSASFLALLYMTAARRDQMLAKARIAASGFHVVFRCNPVQPSALEDLNRLHSFDESLALDGELTKLLALLDIPETKVVSLSGPSKFRASVARMKVMEMLAGGL